MTEQTTTTEQRRKLWEMRLLLNRLRQQWAEVEQLERDAAQLSELLQSAQRSADRVEARVLELSGELVELQRQQQRAAP